MRFLLDGLVDSTGDEVDAEKSLGNVRQRDGGKGKCRPFRLVKKKADSYKNLAPISKFFLFIPGTSVPSDRVFSDTGKFVTKKRASLDPDTVNRASDPPIRK